MRFRRQHCLLMIVPLVVVLAVSGAVAAREKVILDTDMVPLFDDGVAMIMLAQHPRVELMGVCVVTGNRWLEQGTADALRQLEIIGRTDIPVVQGARVPLRTGRYENIELEQRMFGKSGYIGAFKSPEPTSYLDLPNAPYGGYPVSEPAAGHAVDFIIETVKANPGEVTIAAIGPCTNLALAIRKAPEIVPLVKRVVYMGGAFDIPGNTTPAAEFNWWFDPESVKMCINAPFADQMIVPLDVCEKYHFDKSRYGRIVSVDTPLTRMFETIYGPRFQSNPGHWTYVWDTIVAASIIDPAICTEIETRWVDMDVEYGLDYGRSLGYKLEGPAGTQKAKILLTIDEERFWNLVTDLVQKPCR
jgi:inosine-uridine nucleoside N-ribohydrolase